MSKRGHQIYIFILVSIVVLSTGLLIYNGYVYYLTPINERFFNPMYNLLKPSGLIGHGLGIIGSLMMLIGVAGYMMRKRMRMFSNWGLLKHWLEFHIFLCTLGPIFVLFHTSFKFNGIVAVSFWSMVAVVASGVIGRYIYIQIPRTIHGNELGFSELQKMNYEITLKLRKEFNLKEDTYSLIDNISFTDNQTNINLFKIFSTIIKSYFDNRKILKRVKNNMKQNKIGKQKIKEVIKIGKSKIELSRKIAMLKSMQKLFGYWHVVHLPFAILMLVIMLVHVGVTITFGYKWIF